ncbi:hypothetical protein AMTR_s00040p00032200 [Amborella trichopoda]|uniref:Uncharacterized protein n=1 Tax=Amborella trichopoda TaxID=13333 RepID=W1PZF7_AMBTC|nr:hypothetical protein AMTR_s00040p00032200 [Amborella trichopoda]
MAPDRISSLCDEIFRKFSLCCLSEKQAELQFYRSLSKRWTNVWVSTPILNIKNDTNPIQKSKLNWFLIVVWALILHTESIHGFRIHGILPPNHLDRWVHCLSRKGLQELVIEFDSEINEPKSCITKSTVPFSYAAY